jgi:hypothetical protein
MSTPDTIEETNPLYQAQFLIDATQEGLPALVVDKGMQVRAGVTGKHGNVLLVGPTGNVWDSTVLMVSPDTGKIYADNADAKALVESYFA